VSDLAEDPQETIVSLTVLALVLARELKIMDLDLLGRLFLYLGQAMITLAILEVDREAIEKMLNHQTTEDVLAEMEKKIILLERQNEYLQEQFLALQQVIANRGGISGG
jgi:lipid A disaccharide synthetase